MKKLIAFAAATAFAVPALTAPVMANETEDQCYAYADANGTDPAGCACLGEAAAADPALADAIAMIETPEDYEASSPAVKDAVAACWPDA